MYCASQLTGKEKPEHVMLAALGGRKTTRRLVCDSCNNAFGSGPDKALAETANFIRNMMRFPDGKGRSPPSIKGPKFGDHQITLRPGAVPEITGGPPFKITRLADGTQNIEIYARSAEHLRVLIPDLARALCMEVGALKRLLQSGEAKRVRQRIGGGQHHLSFGGPDAMRSMLKSCLTLWADRHGTEEVCNLGYTEAKSFVTRGGEHLCRKLGTLDTRLIGDDHALVSRFGKHLHLIGVASNADGRVIGQYRLYNLCGWRFEMCSSDGVANSSALLVSNPNDPKNWEVIYDGDLISFDWMAQSAAGENFEGPRAALLSMLRGWRDAGVDEEFDRNVSEVMSRMGLQHGQAMTPEQVKRFSGELAHRLTLYALGMPFEERMGPDEIARMVGGDEDDEPT